MAAVEHDGRGVLRGSAGEALSGGAAPEVFNTDQGAQFTSLAFTERVLASGAQCSMDGRGRCMDNVFIERLWRSLKCEAVHFHDLSDGFEAVCVIRCWMEFYEHVLCYPSPYVIEMSGVFWRSFGVLRGVRTADAPERRAPRRHRRGGRFG